MKPKRPANVKTKRKLVFCEWKKSRVVFELLNWEPEKKLAVVTNAKKGTQFMHFVLPWFLDERGRAKPVFPRAPPRTITEVRLVPPPCRTNEAEAQALRVRARQARETAGLVPHGSDWKSAWELRRLIYDDEILIPTPEDYAALRESLILLPDLPWEYQVKQPSVLDRYLHERWANQNNLELRRMADERRKVFAWAGLAKEGVLNPELVFGSPGAASSFYLTIRLNETYGYSTKPNPAEEAELFFGAATRFRVEFTDSSRAWLADCPIDRPQDGSEKQKRNKAWQHKAGAFSHRLHDYPKVALAIKHYIVQRQRSLGPRSMARAIRECKDWVETKYPDAAPIVKKMSYSALRMLAKGQTGQFFTRRFKR